MRVLLAPMEGVLDSLVRELLTEVNDYDLCVTEFLRVVDMLLPVKSFFRLCPELHNQSRTSSGTLVRIQLLGQYPEWLAENAARAVELGSYGVDLNCGCPSKLVNGALGGTATRGSLKSPMRCSRPGPPSWWCMAVPKKMATKPIALTGRRSVRSANASPFR